MPEEVITLLMNLYTQCSAQVITFYGKTDKFPLITGIPQGDALSPLLWRIFYDPLLTRIDNQREGFHMQTEHYSNIMIKQPILKVHSKVNVIAYMDDTTYITSNKQELQNLLKLTEEFTKITGIKINHTKSELLTLNVQQPKDPKPEIQFGTETIKEIGKTEAIRFLGIYIQHKKGKSYQKQMIKTCTRDTCKLLKRKKLTDKEV